MSKELKLNKGDLVELSKKSYEVTVVGKSQITLKSEDGKSRRVTLTSPAYAKIKVITAVEVEKDAETATKKPREPKKRLGVKNTEVEVVKPIDFAEFEAKNLAYLESIEPNPEQHFQFVNELEVSSWWYSIQQAVKGQRIAYIEWKLKQEGPDSLFGLMLALYRTRQEVKCNYEDFEERILVDNFGHGERADTFSIRAILKALKPMINVSRSKVTQEAKDRLIMAVPEDSNQGWCFYFLNSIATDWGSLKISAQDLNNIKIPMA